MNEPREEPSSRRAGASKVAYCSICPLSSAKIYAFVGGFDDLVLRSGAKRYTTALTHVDTAFERTSMRDLSRRRKASFNLDGLTVLSTCMILYHRLRSSIFK